MSVDALQSQPHGAGLSDRLHSLVGLGPTPAAPAARVRTRGVYIVPRHPVYLSFLGLTGSYRPSRPTGLMIIWTAYVFVGSWLKDQRLLSEYRAYLERVPGFPGMTFGPLARWPRPQTSGEHHHVRRSM